MNGPGNLSIAACAASRSRRDSCRHILGIVIAVWLFLTVASRLAASDPDATTYQNNSAHDGSATFTQFTATPTKLWSVNLGHSVSYPLIAQGEVYVTAGDEETGTGSHIYALNAQTGHIDWSVALNSMNAAAMATYDNGRVFVFNDHFTSSTMNAYDASTGALLWTTPLANYSFNSAPTASNGIVYVGSSGSGGTLSALRESDGATLWRASVDNGDNSSLP